MLFLKSIIKKVKLLESWNVIILFIFTFVIYIHNLSPSVYGGDSGDILTAAIVNGVAHPSGYPLQTMLGILFLKLPITATPAWKVGLISAVFSSSTVVLMYLTLRKLHIKWFLALATSFTLAFLYPFWLYAEIVEVFALNSFFILCLLYLTISFLEDKNKKYLFYLSFVTGLSLTNNLSIIISFPAIGASLFIQTSRKLRAFCPVLKRSSEQTLRAFARKLMPLGYELFIANKKLFFDLKTVAVLFIFFVLGLTPYVYIPLAAKNYPAISWGYAVNLKNFISLVLREHYGWATTKTVDRFTITNSIYRLGTYFEYWKIYIHPLIPFLIMAGYIQILKEKRDILAFLLLISFLATGPFFVIYAGGHFKSFLNMGIFEKFLISNFLSLFILVPFGVTFFQELASKAPAKKGFAKFLKCFIYLIFISIPIISLVVNYPKTNFQNIYLGDNLGKDILSSLPQGSVLLLRNDSLSFNTIYYQQAYNFRQDVKIPGMHNSFDCVLKSMEMSDEEITTYKITQKGTIEKDVLDAAIGPLIKKGNVFIDGVYSVTDTDHEKIVTVPYGLLYKLEFYDNLPYSKEDYLRDLEKLTSSYHLESLMGNEEMLSYSLIYGDVKKLYSVGFLNISNFLHEQYNEDELAVKYLIKSAELDPLAITIEP